MTPIVACLHTAAGNAAIFDGVCPPGLTLRHAVHPELLAEAERDGFVSETLAVRTAAVLTSLRRDAAAVLLTCSTLGTVVERMPAASAPVLRADAALAAETRRRGGRVLVLCATTTTLESTRALFDDGSGRVRVELVAGAWQLFRAGALASYHAAIAQVADAAFAAGIDTVALAQVSMTGAAAVCQRGEPLTVPAAGLCQVEVISTKPTIDCRTAPSPGPSHRGRGEESADPPPLVGGVRGGGAAVHGSVIARSGIVSS